MRQPRALALVALLTTLLAACGWPVDPEGTFAEAAGGELRIGVVADPPWTLVETDEVVGGVEVELAKELAAALNAEPVFRVGTTQRLAEALARFDLHLLVGGLTAGSAWGSQVALTPPYFTEEYVVATAEGRERVEGIDGREVLYPAEQPRLASWIEELGGLPLEAEGFYGPSSELNPTQVGDTLLAVPAWRADQLGLVPVGTTLAADGHVMAVPPGENRMLMELTRFLDRATDPVDLLAEVVP